MFFAGIKVFHPVHGRYGNDAAAIKAEWALPNG